MERDIYLMPFSLAGEFTPDEDDDYLDDGADERPPESDEGDEQDPDLEDDGEESEERPAPKDKKEAAPQYVTLEQFNQQMSILTNLATSVQGLAQGFNATVRKPATPEEKEIPEVTDEEWDEADGDPKAMRKLRQQERARDAQLHRRELAQVQATGFQAISGLMKDKLNSLEFYKDYKAEVDSMISELPEHAQLNPQVIEACYNQVVARHINEIRDKDRQATARQKALKTQTSVPSGRNGRSVRREHDDEDEDYDDDARDTLDTLGMDKDEFAKSMGYRDHKDYVKRTKTR